jgi:MOSC domain-containing protein YiiM
MPISGSIEVRKLGLVGDAQADTTVHGGPTKAVYAYPAEHYDYWIKELGDRLGWGMFGENLTTKGYTETELHVGDVLRIGSAELTITQPRFPCFKLGIRFQDMEMVKRFQASGRCGFYLSVRREGKIKIGDSIQLISRFESNPTIAEMFKRE